MLLVKGLLSNGDKSLAGDRQMRVYGRDAAAIAIVLADCGNLSINDGSGTRETKYFLERHRRIKLLLQKASLDHYDSVQIPFFHENEEKNK